MSASLRRFIITRLLLTIPMVLILVTMIFFIMRILPGDPIRSQLGPRVSEEQANQLRERLGLNRPLYVQYFDFQEKGSDQLDQEVEKLIKEGAEGIIFDLRNNLGGVLDDAVEVSDLFLDEGMIVSIKGRVNNQDRVDEYFAKKGGYTDVPLVVLINGFSASASELVAGAL